MKRIKCFITDIDGVLTDGRIFYLEGRLMRFFNIKDGLAFRLLAVSGIEPAIVSGKKSVDSRQRFAELGVKHYFDGIDDKLTLVRSFLEEEKLSWDEICFMGDDLPDIPVMKKAGFSAAPADASEEVKKVSDYTCKNKGGRGAFREAVEKLLKEQGKWEETLKKFFSLLS